MKTGTAQKILFRTGDRKSDCDEIIQASCMQLPHGHRKYLHEHPEGNPLVRSGDHLPSHILPRSGIEPGSNRWEASVTSTTLTGQPLRKQDKMLVVQCNVCNVTKILLSRQRIVAIVAAGLAVLNCGYVVASIIFIKFSLRYNYICTISVLYNCL